MTPTGLMALSLIMAGLAVLVVAAIFWRGCSDDDPARTPPVSGGAAPLHDAGVRARDARRALRLLRAREPRHHDRPGGFSDPAAKGFHADAIERRTPTRQQVN